MKRQEQLENAEAQAKLSWKTWIKLENISTIRKEIGYEQQAAFFPKLTTI